MYNRLTTFGILTISSFGVIVRKPSNNYLTYITTEGKGLVMKINTDKSKVIVVNRAINI